MNLEAAATEAQNAHATNVTPIFLKSGGGQTNVLKLTTYETVVDRAAKYQTTQAAAAVSTLVEEIGAFEQTINAELEVQPVVINGRETAAWQPISTEP